MTGQWMKTPWSTAHFVADRPLCGTDLPIEAILPAPDAPRCGTCEVAKARRERGAAKSRAWRAAQRVPAPEPVYVGPDPLVDVLRRYERGEL